MDPPARFHQIILGDSDFFQIKETPAELRFGAVKGTKDKTQRRTKAQANFLMRQDTGDSDEAKGGEHGDEMTVAWEEEPFRNDFRANDA
eukprot:Skav217449  [mRNA]  locus=scaffold518:158397:165656:- [translate_table: standard]